MRKTNQEITNQEKKQIEKKTIREIIQLSLPEPPVTPFTSVAPLVFVVVVTMIKQVGRK